MIYASAIQDNEPWKQKQNGLPFISLLRFDSLNRHTALGIMHARSSGSQPYVAVSVGEPKRKHLMKTTKGKHYC